MQNYLFLGRVSLHSPDWHPECEVCHHTQLKRNPKSCLETMTRELKYAICSCLAHLRMHGHVAHFLLFSLMLGMQPRDYTFQCPSCPALKEFPETFAMCVVLDLHLLCSLLRKQYLSSIIHTFLVALILSAQCVPFYFTTNSLSLDIWIFTVVTAWLYSNRYYIM